MPYSLVFNYADGTTGEIKPLCCDNPKSPHGLEDRKIKTKALKLAKQLTRRFDDLECSVIHYEA